MTSNLQEHWSDYTLFDVISMLDNTSFIKILRNKSFSKFEINRNIKVFYRDILTNKIKNDTYVLGRYKLSKRGKGKVKISSTELVELEEKHFSKLSDLGIFKFDKYSFFIDGIDKIKHIIDYKQIIYFIQNPDKINSKSQIIFNKVDTIITPKDINIISHSDELKQKNIKLAEQYLREKLLYYKSNFEGISDSYLVRKFCLHCGSSDIQGKENREYIKYCAECGTQWYLNHCWNCHEMIDSRDKTISRCEYCGWYICTCGSCKSEKCKGYLSRIINTNHYKRAKDAYQFEMHIFNLLSENKIIEIKNEVFKRNDCIPVKTQEDINADMPFG